MAEEKLTLKVESLKLSKEALNQLKLSGIDQIKDFNTFSIKELKLLLAEAFEEVTSVLRRYSLPRPLENMGVSGETVDRLRAQCLEDLIDVLEYDRHILYHLFEDDAILREELNGVLKFYGYDALHENHHEASDVEELENETFPQKLKINSFEEFITNLLNHDKKDELNSRIHSGILDTNLYSIIDEFPEDYSLKYVYENNKYQNQLNEYFKDLVKNKNIDVIIHILQPNMRYTKRKYPLMFPSIKKSLNELRIKETESFIFIYKLVPNTIINYLSFEIFEEKHWNLREKLQNNLRMPYFEVMFDMLSKLKNLKPEHYKEIVTSILQLKDINLFEALEKTPLNLNNIDFYELLELSKDISKLNDNRVLQLYLNHSDNVLDDILFEGDKALLFDNHMLLVEKSSFYEKLEKNDFKEYIYRFSKLSEEHFYLSITTILEKYDNELIFDQIEQYRHYNNKNNDYIDQLKLDFKKNHNDAILSKIMFYLKVRNSEDIFELIYAYPNFIKLYEDKEFKPILKAISYAVASENYNSVFLIKLLLDLGLDINIKIEDKSLLEYFLTSDDYDIDEDMMHDDFFADGGFGAITSLHNVIFSYHPKLDGWIKYKGHYIPFITRITSVLDDKDIWYSINKNNIKGALRYSLINRGDHLEISGFLNVVDVEIFGKAYTILSGNLPLEKNQKIQCYIEGSKTECTITQSPYTMSINDYTNSNELHHYVEYDDQELIQIEDTPEDSYKSEVRREVIKPLTAMDNQLIEAVKKNKLEMVSEFIKKGANINVQTQYYIEDVPLWGIAYLKKYKDMFLLLLKSENANIHLMDSSDESIIDLIIERGDENYFKLLIENFISLDDKNPNGDTYKNILKNKAPQLYAKYVDATEITFEKVDLEIALNSLKMNQVDYILEVMTISDKELFAKVLNKSIVWEIKNVDKMIIKNPEFASYFRGNIITNSIIRSNPELLDIINFKDEEVNKYIPFHAHHDTYYTEREYEKQELTPLQFAFLMNNFEMIDIFLKRGGDINHLNKMGRSSIFYVQSSFQLERILNLGGDPMIKDNDNLNAVEYILYERRIELDDFSDTSKYLLAYIIYNYGYNIKLFLNKLSFLDTVDYENKKVMDIFLREPFLEALYNSSLEDFEYYKNLYEIVKKIIDAGLDVYYVFDEKQNIFNVLESHKESKSNYAKAIQYIKDNNKIFDKTKIVDYVKLSIVLVQVRDSNRLLSYKIDKYEPKLGEEVLVPYGREQKLGIVRRTAYTIYPLELSFEVSKLKSIISS